ncbi:MAG: IS110 family transposase [Lachnospiraceae bacterium]|nr:IS110 family transposase [Lachnospiraceae bacterium]
MNLTQNDKLNQVTADTLIVGVDIGSQIHFARAFDWRCFEFTKRVFRFGNTKVGFLSFLRWLEEIQKKTGKTKVIVGCEPTGCYWLTFQKFLQQHGVLLVTVNPASVKRSKELDDNSPEKSDLKDPKTIAGLVKDGRFSTSYLPTGVYAEIREAFVCRDQIMKQHVRLSNQIQGWLQKYFPEYFECYKDWDSTSGLMVLQHAPLPQDIIRIGAGGINEIWRNAKVRAAGIARATTLLEAAQNSVGLEGGEAARIEIWILVNDYIAKAEQLKRIDEYLEQKVMEVPHVEKLLAIKGVGLSTVIGFVAEVGDIGRFTDPRQIQKLAGLEITKISSGKRKGKPGISKRGRCKLRRVMYESARALINWNPAFSDVFLYYRNREQRPLGGMQAKIAVACKAIRVFFVILQTGCDFDEEHFRRDIIRQEAA